MAFSEFSSTDPAATRSFLEKVFGWRFESVKFPMGEYLSFRTPGGGQGGIRPAQAKEIPGSTSYVRVDHLDAARKKVERAGGEIVLPRVVSWPRGEDRLGPGGLRCPAVCANVQPVRCDVTREKVMTDGGEVEILHPGVLRVLQRSGEEQQ